MYQIKIDGQAIYNNGMQNQQLVAQERKMIMTYSKKLAGFLALLICLTALTCSGDGSTLVLGALTPDCEIYPAGLDRIEWAVTYNDCNRIGIEIFPTALLADEGMTVFEIRGTYFSFKTRDFYLRGNSLPASNSCLHGLSGEGEFSLPIAFSECPSDIELEVVSVIYPEGDVFCSLKIEPGLPCP